MADDEPTYKSMAEVQREDAEWTAAADAEIFDDKVEAAALQNLVAGSSASAMREACASLNMTAKFEDAVKMWQSQLGSKSADQLGAAVREVVVVKLEAPHLKPSGIESRLAQGVNASCFGLFSLLQHLATTSAETKS